MPTVSKVFEHALKILVTRYLEQHNIIDEEQHGFRIGQSTKTLLNLYHEKIMNGLEGKELAVADLLNLSKAFDKVPHTFLLDKLEYFGFQCTAQIVLKTYLIGRQQAVKCGMNISVLLSVNSVVPRGPILGPLLFITYTTDMRC